MKIANIHIQFMPEEDESPNAITIPSMRELAGDLISQSPHLSNMLVKGVQLGEDLQPNGVTVLSAHLQMVHVDIADSVFSHDHDHDHNEES